MKNIFVGEYIRNRRKELKLTQEQLCSGICDPTTLSRIETGAQAPSRTCLNALLQRLGMCDERYYAIESKNELKIEALKKEIVSCNVLGRTAEGYAKIEQLEELIEPDNRLTRQFILHSKAILGHLDRSCSLTEQLDLLMEAIRLTVPHFALDKINSFLYTFDEAKLINQIAGVYSRMQQTETALSIYRQLLQYIHVHYQELLTSNGLLPMVLHNYARELGLAKCYKESIAAAEEGRQTCIRYGYYQSLPGFLAIKGECYHFLGQDEKSTENYTQAYYLYRAFENFSFMKTVQKEAKEYLNMTFS